MTTTAMDLEEIKLLDGHTFVASADADLGNGATLVLTFENPSDSGTEAVFYFGELTQEGESEVILYDDISSVSGGSSGSVENNHIGHSNPTELTVTQDPTFSGDNIHQRVTYVGSGSFQLFDGYKVLLPPGANMAVQITNGSGGDSETSVRLSWAEKPA